MMPILVKSDDVRSGKKAKVPHGRLLAAQESMDFCPTLISNNNNNNNNDNNNNS